jgi:hypothetical protein
MGEGFCGWRRRGFSDEMQVWKESAIAVALGVRFTSSHNRSFFINNLEYYNLQHLSIISLDEYQ